MITFYLLPIELIYQISSFLNLNDVLNLRSTCRYLKYALNRLPNRKLITFIKNYPFNFDLFNPNYYDNDLSEIESYSYLRDSLRLASTKPFCANKFKNTFSMLRKLCIIHDDDNSGNRLFHIAINLTDLNHFKELDHLEIDIGRLEGNLCLPKLKVCSIRTRNSSEFTMDIPNLRSLRLDGQVFPQLSRTTNLTNLIFLNGFFQHFKRILKDTPNLTCLTLNIYSTAKQFIAFKPFELKSLKKLNICEANIDNNAIDELISNMRFYPNLNVYFYNHDLKDPRFIDSLNEIRFNRLMTNLATFDSNSFELLDIYPNIFFNILPFVREIHLVYSVRLNKDKVFRLKKLTKLVLIKSSLDNLDFKMMLNCFKNLKYLKFESTELDQEKLDVLPKYFQNLRFLSIKDCNHFNSKFILRFKNLIHLEFDNQIGPEELKYLMDNSFHLPFLESIVILYQSFNFRIPFSNMADIKRFTVLRNNLEYTFFKTLNLVGFIFSSISDSCIPVHA